MDTPAAARAVLAQASDPIVAVATAPGRGAIGVVRVSGPSLDGLVAAVCGRALPPRLACYGPFLDARGEAIDRGLAIHFPAPHSYTGEDVLELQAHGGPVVLQLLVSRCLEAAATPARGRTVLPGLRLAAPGEFTRRAFLNGKLDLAQAEAVADLIDASTEAAARSAARSVDGAFSREVGALAGALVELRMLVEATLDFPEEEIEFLRSARAAERLDALAGALESLRARARQGALLRDGLRVVIAGQPNAGKSSLLNALAGAELAIVTPIPGTTRDRIAGSIQVEGVPLHVVDTAGLRPDEQAADEVERIGIGRSWEAIADADAVLFVHDLSRAGEPAHEAADGAIRARLPAAVPCVDVHNKADAAPERAAALPLGEVAISARTGDGIETLRRRLLSVVGWQVVPEGMFIARERHQQALRAASGHVDEARRLALQGDAALELLAEELRLAHEALGAITGEFGAEDLLGAIFSRFCIGK
jgi:tRNA modification GTPase